MNERYKEYLKSGEWKYLREQKLTLAKYTCDGCNETGRVLDVHHLTYERIGMELLTDLAVYCQECHNTAHGRVAPNEWNDYLHNITDVKPKDRILQDIKFMKMLDS